MLGLPVLRCGSLRLRTRSCHTRGVQGWRRDGRDEQTSEWVGWRTCFQSAVGFESPVRIDRSLCCAGAKIVSCVPPVNPCPSVTPVNLRTAGPAERSGRGRLGPYRDGRTRHLAVVSML